MAIKLTESAIKRIVREENSRLLREGAAEDIEQAYTLIQGAINGLGLNNRQKNTELRHLEAYIEKARGLINITTPGGGQDMFDELLRMWDAAPAFWRAAGINPTVPYPPPPVDIQDLTQNYTYDDRIRGGNISFSHVDYKTHRISIQIVVQDRDTFTKMQKWLRSIGMKKR